jgi:hypothetical protein
LFDGRNIGDRLITLLEFLGKQRMACVHSFVSSRIHPQSNLMGSQMLHPMPKKKIAAGETRQQMQKSCQGAVC